jgi:hypothetical protein
MIGVDKIGAIRRAYFERHLPIKEIVRTLSVSRATLLAMPCAQVDDRSRRREVQAGVPIIAPGVVRQDVDAPTENGTRVATGPRSTRSIIARQFAVLPSPPL